VCVLANVLEAHGLATVAMVNVRGQAERGRAPRAMYCEFPLGRPLGRPGDPAFQRSVLERLLALLERPPHDLPVLVDHPDAIDDDATRPLACTLPPRFDASTHPAADEALGLRAAYERTRVRNDGRTALGKTLAPEEIPGVVEALARIADEGAPLEELKISQDPGRVAADVRAYYEEAALSLTDHVPAARQAETWFFQGTETGALLRRLQRVLKEQGHPRLIWYYLVPSAQQDHRPASPFSS
jgi:hypothetical protein